MNMDAERMLENAAAASQNQSLDEPVTRGAILRSMEQWLTSIEDGDLDFALWQLRKHPDFDK